MALEKALLDILACPVDKGGLLYFDDEMILYNPRLRRRYRISNNIPIMLAHHADTVTDDEHARLVQLADAGGAIQTLG
ncbi:MAG: Trm112 family protein [Streptosporangiaceae bacterium]